MSTAIYVGKKGINLLGKNQDNPYDGAYIFTNKRNVTKRAMVMPPDHPAEWSSRYGSLIITQVGKEMPNGGMNEAGLVVEQTTLWQSAYSENSVLPAIGELPWMQLLLDTCSSVQEAIETASRVRIVQPMSRLHYIVCDRLKDCAIIEFLNGEMNVYRGNTLPISIMANTPYVEAVRDLEDMEEKWHIRYDDYSRNSMERLKRVATSIALPIPSNEGEHIGYLFEALQSARREDTAYSLVYDLEKLELHFLSNQYPERKVIRLKELDFSLHSSAKVIDLHQLDHGICNDRFEEYNSSMNRIVVESFFQDPVLTEAFGWTITEEMINFLASFPDLYQSGDE
ncbi:linear amide C-N hydrolase [Paenibacillus endoradicis]|uniref:linear amide C-N hydrolase n=1 Tax=Paenibacillus endoradicis TaxID=2972487 RepID=UPI002159A0DA|nr:linear amide C-N hydrolase [Paenibacillus endoradicis]